MRGCRASSPRGRAEAGGGGRWRGTGTGGIPGDLSPWGPRSRSPRAAPLPRFRVVRERRSADRARRGRLRPIWRTGADGTADKAGRAGSGARAFRVRVLTVVTGSGCGPPVLLRAVPMSGRGAAPGSGGAGNPDPVVACGPGSCIDVIQGSAGDPRTPGGPGGRGPRPAVCGGCM